MNRAEYEERLAHAAGYKYIKREWKNGRWVYDYGDKEKDSTYVKNRAADNFNKSVEAIMEQGRSVIAGGNNPSTSSLKRLGNMIAKNGKATIEANKLLTKDPNLNYGTEEENKYMGNVYVRAANNRDYKIKKKQPEGQKAQEETYKKNAAAGIATERANVQKEQAKSSTYQKQSQSMDPQADRWISQENANKKAQADAAAKSMSNKLADIRAGQKSKADNAHAENYAKNAAAGEANAIREKNKEILREQVKKRLSSRKK